jgi:radical SAM protein with 4Fe4S-binding SPASM domain
MKILKRIYKRGVLKAWEQYKDIIRSEHKLVYLFWECTLNCNFFCKHCGSSAGRKIFPGELNTLEIKKAFKSIAEDYDPRQIMIAVTGGEPLLRKDIFEVMKYAHDLGFPWGVVTNGSLLDEGMAQKMKEAGMSTVSISIDGIGGTHDKFRGSEGAYEKAVKAVKILVDADFLDCVQITTSMNKGNFKELDRMYETFLSLGIDSWRVMNVDPIGRAEENKNIILSPAELEGLLTFIKRKRKESEIDIVYGCEGFLGLDFEGEVRDKFFICNTGINTGSILHNGDIFVCPNVPRRSELIQGNVRRDRFSEVWNNKYEIFRNKERTKCAKCAACDYWGECLGGSFHLWDFEKKQPKICHMEILGR